MLTPELPAVTSQQTSPADHWRKQKYSCYFPAKTNISKATSAEGAKRDVLTTYSNFMLSE